MIKPLVNISEILGDDCIYKTDLAVIALIYEKKIKDKQ